MRWIYRHPRIYDLVDTVFSFALSDRLRRRVLNGLSSTSLLDIGVGSGKCLKRVSASLILGVDTSVHMLNRAQARFPGARLILGSAHSLPLRDGSVEVSVFSYSLSVLNRPVEAVREALRVSSKVIVIEYDKPRFIPGFVWHKVLGRFGWRVYGSTNIDFTTIESLARKKIAQSFCGRLYRVVVLEGAKHA